MSKSQKPIPRIHKQRARRRAESNITSAAKVQNLDSNAVEILPTSSAEREQRRRKLREELRAAKPESKSSAQKRKRLDKYIDTKLKKDESAELIKKLAAQGQVDTSLLLSSKRLGRGDETKRELLGRTLRERRAGIGGEDDEDVLMEERVRNTNPTALKSETIRPAIETVTYTSSAQAVPEEVPNGAAESVISAATPAFGAGLKRPLDVDDEGRPIIQKRMRMKLKRRGWNIAVNGLPKATEGEDGDVPEETSEWEGFSSEEDGGVRLKGNDEVDDEVEEGSGIDFDDRTSGSESELESQTDGDVSEEAEEDEEVNEGEDEDQAGPDDSQKSVRLNAFKAWATSQRNQALGFQSSNALDDLRSVKDDAVNSKRVSADVQRQGPSNPNTSNRASGHKDVLDTKSASALPKVGELKDNGTTVFHVPVHRSAHIEEGRLALPVVAEEQKIMEAIRANDMVFICGSTGSGKTTQVPQFLFEAGYGNSEGPTPGLIGVTQPRRVAAISMANRVGAELDSHPGKVSHQIRFDSTVTKETAIKFMTDGVLLREIGQDFMLSKYSAIVLDEAHERSVNTDILIGMLTRVVETRAMWSKKSTKHSPLKVVIMSATLETAKLLENESLFRHGNPPVVQAEGRQHPVTIHFAKHTEREYLEQAFLKISRGHKKLPQGAMLVFLTGQNEIQQLSQRLRQTFACTHPGDDRSFGKIRISAAETTIEAEDIELGKLLDDHKTRDQEDDGETSDSDAEIRGLDNDFEEFDIGEHVDGEVLRVHVLPLYSQLPTEQQMRVFQPPPPGSRLIVLATNVAETSLTIPGVRYVFDCGRAKEKRYDQSTGVQTFDVGWISKASAAQRTGRAGRTGPGHCYRLYSSAVYERDFAEFAEPEISRSSIEGVVLQLKSMGIPRIETFPFPEPPDRESLLRAERLLHYLGALQAGKVTDLGNQLAHYPLSPRLARMLCTAAVTDVLVHTTALVAVLTVGDLFIPEAQLGLRQPEPKGEDERWTEADNQEVLQRERRRKVYNAFHFQLSRYDQTCDAVKLLAALNDYVRRTSDEDFGEYTRTKALIEAVHLQQQLATIAALHSPGIPMVPFSALPEPSKAQLKSLRMVVASGYIDHIAQRADLSPTPPTSDKGRSFKPKKATDMPYLTLFTSKSSSSRHVGDPAIDMEDPENKARMTYVFIHPESSLARRYATQPQKLPQYIVYSHLSTAAIQSVVSAKLPRTRLHPLTPVSAEQIVSLTAHTPLLSHSKPIGRIETLARDDQGRERRAIWTIPYLVPGSEAGGGGEMGWPMPPARKVIQRREGARGWVEES